MIQNLKFAFLLLLISVATGRAQEPDMDGSKDHPMFTRMPNFYIGDYDANFDRVQMYLNVEGDEKAIEGDKTYISYLFDENSGKKCPSAFQILKNHENAIKKIGGKIVYTDNERYATYIVKKDGHETWVKLEVVNQGYAYYLNIVEVAPMEQEISANALFTKLESEGSVSLYINFDTGKSVIKEDSKAIIEEIVKMMQENPDLKISVEGHTDNVGAPAANKALSLNRAKAVMNAITTEGIPAARLKANGWGQEKPVGDNSTEEGKAQNRRVEIVKI